MQHDRDIVPFVDPAQLQRIILQRKPLICQRDVDEWMADLCKSAVSVQPAQNTLTHRASILVTGFR